MKVRKGFVSNSSSSSFIIIGDYIEAPEHVDYLIINKDSGESEFGWQEDEYFDTGSKIIFAYLQILYSENDDWREMFMGVLEEYYNTSNIHIDISTELPNWSYIDHQSSAYEGECIEMFDDRDSLVRFLFGPESYIRTDNDNH